MLDPQIEQEGAEWVVAMVSEHFDSFIPPIFCDLVFANEQFVRDESGDPQMDHATMTDRLMAMFEADPNVPTDDSPMMPSVIFEILHYEDQFRSMAGQDRQLRPPTGQR